MKKISTFLLSAVILVASLGVTGVFADSWPPYALSGNDVTVNFSENGFTVSSPSSNQFMYFSGVNSISGSVSWSSDLVYPNNTNLFSFPVRDSTTSVIFSNLVNTKAYGNGLSPDGAQSSGSFDFTIITSNTSFNTGQARFCTASNHSTTFSFSSLILNGNTIISGSSSNTFSLSLPYGNAMRIYSDSPFTITSRAYTVRDTTYNFQKYVRASDDFSYRVNGTYQGVVQDSSLVGNFSLSVFGSDNVLSLLVPWQPTNQNILGRATAYNYYSASPDPTASVSVGSGESFLVWYPYYANNQDTSMLNEVPMDMSIIIEHSSPVFFMTYPITGNPSSGEDTYISNTSNVSDGGSSQQIDDGDGNVTVTFDNAPTAGGNHGQAPINQNNSILGVLSNLQNTLLGLFNKAIDGIHNLISLGSDFLQSVQVMFSWLPSELLLIITSGFVILLTIGVLKTLWR